MKNANNWRRLTLNSCACGCGTRVAKTYAKGHGRRRPLLDRLLKKIDLTDSCWLWTGALDRGGYGRVGTGSHTTAVVHRAVYEALVEPIREGLHIDHLCRNRRCCNPDHLEPVTQAENNRRALEAASEGVSA